MTTNLFQGSTSRREFLQSTAVVSGGLMVGVALPGLIDERGWKDLFGYTLQITVVGVADELAAAASLVMGQASEGTPVVHVRGFPFPLRDGALKEMIRPKDQDMFR